MVKEFKEFIARGNAIDLAIGVVLGVAFGAIVTSLVDDVIMPLAGLVLGGADFTNAFFVLREGAATAGPYETLASAKAAGAVTVNYGVFINTIVSFIIIAIVLFFVVRSVNAIRKPPPEPEMKDCPFCTTSVAIAATRCPACTSQLS